MANLSDFRNGLCIEFNDQIYQIVNFQHVKPGKGPAFVRTKLKNMKTGKVIENTFSGGAKITAVRVERRPYQYLYKDDSGYNFMNAETFEQVSIDPEMVENADLMKEGMTIEITYHTETETPLTAELPPFIELECTYAEPTEKGNTASSTALKAVTVETGATIMVPLFINEGDVIKVDTRDRSYSERIKR
ncbi:MAG: elongation factor P [Marinilabiliales bacterium]|nr:elongation factor P [Marinilabiliales bacterium]